MKRLIVIILLTVIAASAMSAFALHIKNEPKVVVYEDAPLYFDANEEFVVVQFADFHEWAAKEDTLMSIILRDSLKPRLEQYIRSVLYSVKPDLVVLTGDNIFCLSWMDAVYKVSESTIKMMADIFEDMGVYWTFTFGNHDTEGAITKNAFIEAVEPYQYFLGGLESEKYCNALSYAASEDDFRAGNYSIPVYNAEKTRVAYNIFLLDSGSYLYAPPKGVSYRYILDGQVDWYAAEAQAFKEVNGGAPVPSLMFTHIPLFEHKEAYLQKGESIGNWAGISPSETRSKIFEKALETGDVRGIFAGHNHYNSYTGFYTSGDKKIMMGVTPQAKASSYEDTTSTMYSRVIRLNQNGNLDTYIHTSNTKIYSDGIYKGEHLEYDKE